MKKIILAVVVVVFLAGLQAVVAADKPAYEIKAKSKTLLLVVAHEPDSLPAGAMSNSGFSEAFAAALIEIEKIFYIQETIPVTYTAGLSSLTKVLLVRVRSQAKLW